MVLITGYRGLAETLIEEFTASGCALSVLVRNTEAIDGLRARFPDHEFFLGDVASGADCKRWVESAVDRFGQIDCLINNAAIAGPGGKLNDISFVDFRLAMDVNFLAPVRLIKFVLPYFLKAKSGVVINLSGGGATQARPHFSAYASAKCALVRFTESVAAEYPNLCFYSISPGGLLTPMIEKVLQMGPDAIGIEYDEAKCRSETGGEDPRKAARLAQWLFRNRPAELSGALVSAVWDDYENFQGLRSGVEWWRLRRVDSVLAQTLASSETLEEN